MVVRFTMATILTLAVIGCVPAVTDGDPAPTPVPGGKTIGIVPYERSGDTTPPAVEFLYRDCGYVVLAFSENVEVRRPQDVALITSAGILSLRKQLGNRLWFARAGVTDNHPLEVVGLANANGARIRDYGGNSAALDMMTNAQSDASGRATQSVSTSWW